MSRLRQKSADGLRTGDTFTIERTFTEREIADFAAMSGDYGAVHFDRRFAESQGFNGLICQGLLVAGMITEIGGQVAWLASYMSFKYKAPVYPGDTIRCTYTITRLDEETGKATGEGLYLNQHDVVVLESLVKGVIPGIEQRGVLQAMLDEDDPTNKLGHKYQ